MVYSFDNLKVHGKRLLIEPDKTELKKGKLIISQIPDDPSRHVEPFIIKKIGNPKSPFKTGQRILIPVPLGTRWTLFEKEYRFIDEDDVFGYFPIASSVDQGDTGVAKVNFTGKTEVSAGSEG